MDTSIQLLFTNARVVTLSPRQPYAESVAVRGQTIFAVGKAEELSALAGPATRIVDCQGLTLLPGFVDSHCHLLALASSLAGLDCRPGSVPSIQALKQLVRCRAERTPAGEWVRGYGYDDLALAEERHPGRADLDSAAPHHPVRLDHRSGHAVVLNSAALRLAGIHRDTPDPPEGVIERDEATGEPTGLLLEMAGFLRHRLGTSRRTAQWDEGIDRLNRLLLGYGITSVQDAGPENGLERWRTFQELKLSGRLAPRITMMAGGSRLDEFADTGIVFGSGDAQLRLGHAKLMLTMTTGALHPGIRELEEMVALCHRSGFPVAIHAVEEEAVAAAAEALTNVPSPERTGQASGTAGDRIEHCSECPPELVQRVKASGATVVTQPGFIYWNGDRYLRQVSPRLLPHIYAIEALARAGAPVAFGSDAPVIDPAPWPAIYAAVSRTSREGSQLPGARDSGAVPLLAALRRYTVAGACSEGTGDRKGVIAEGNLADMTLVDADLNGVEPSRLKDIRTVLTIVGGELAWDAGL